MRLADLESTLTGLGARPCHTERVLRAWLGTQSLDGGPRPAASFLPRAVNEALPGLWQSLGGLARIVSSHPGKDGSERLLIALPDEQQVESVLLPRDGLCVSTQVGCAVGCTFCMTGRDGLLRQLDAAEILAQVVLARRHRPVRKVVFMGMGEPAHNLDAVMTAIDRLGRFGGIGHKNLVLSTVGDHRLFDRLDALRPGDVRPALAVSLHSFDPALREKLLPKAPRIDPGTLLARASAYARATRHPIQYQWTLLAGMNDGPADMDAIVSNLAGHYAVLNFIPFNPGEDLPHQRPEWAHCCDLIRQLHRRHILAKLRDSAGQEIDGGCGQLRARASASRSNGARASSETTA